jgi:hypothetical protein
VRSVELHPVAARGDPSPTPTAIGKPSTKLGQLQQELGSWSLDEDQWPKTLDLETFRRWFEVVGESVVVDLSPEELELEHDEF